MIKTKLNKLHTVQKLYIYITQLHYKYTSQTLCRITVIHEKVVPLFLLSCIDLYTHLLYKQNIKYPIHHSSSKKHMYKAHVSSGLISDVTTELGGEIVHWVNGWPRFHCRGSIGKNPVALLCELN